MSLSNFSLKRPVTTMMIGLCALVVGIVALDRLPMEQFPSISSSGITARVQYNNASPEEIERQITLPLEQTLGTMNNIDRISASSGRNSGEVRVDFKSGTDMDLANMEMREKVDQARALFPSDVDRVSLRRWQSDQRPIVYANLAWHGDGDRLLDVIQKVIEPRMLRLPGVANVVIDDLEAKQLIIELDQERLQTHNISLPSLGWQLNQNNTNISLGRVMDGGQRYMVRAVGEFKQAEDISDMPLLGGQFRLGDIGEINYGFPEKKRYERLNGVDALQLEIFKASTANVVDVGDVIVAELAKIEADYDGKLDVAIVRNRAESVLKEASTLLDSALMGAFLAMIIIFVFLRNIRSTIVIALAIPTSALCVFIGMYVAREAFDSPITLNMVSMMGMMLAVGMLVDPAVVVLESIFRRRQEDGLSADEAASVGSGEVGMAVLASSLTTICVFVPFFFLSDGRSAMWMKDAGLTICLAVVVSMIVSLSLIPLASSRLFRDGLERFDNWLKLLVVATVTAIAYMQVADLGWHGLGIWWTRWSGLILASLVEMPWSTWTGFGVSGLVIAAFAWYCSRHGLRSSYGRLLNWNLNHRWVSLLATVALTGTGYYLYDQIEQRGTPWTPERRVDMSVVIDRSYSLDEIREHFDKIEDILLAKKDELDIESLTTDFRQRRGGIRAYLVDADAGNLSSMEAGNAMKKLLPEKIGFTYKMGRSRGWSGNQLGVEVQLHGRNPEVLAVLMEEVKANLEIIPGVQDVDSSLEDGEEEVRVEVNRAQALNYGLSPREVAQSISSALGTRRTSGFKSDDREIDIVMQLNEGDRATLDQLKNSLYEGRDGNSVQLAALANFNIRRGPSDLKRANRVLNVTVFANTESRGAARTVMGPIKAIMEGMQLPPGYSWDLGRAARWEQEDANDNNFTAIFAVLLIYLIMASLFESLIHPFTIMLSIPFSLIGVALGLYALDVPFDNNCQLGLLILFGVVVNNGIVLIAHINHLRETGLSRREAIVTGGQHRLRPILMTAFTTILNLMPIVLPMVYGTSEGFARRWGPVGLVVVSGLASSTILTLMLAPTLYSLLDDFSLWCKRVMRDSHKTGPAHEIQPAH
ncbi:MAG: efflux RND transporter permease subunit [Gemmatimonadetes bacterium]|jgi:hydrophobic/amphiphilic exporter-1 (mainly G- bacteria), HAE1 family|nr:efflux RND transporter permease subunit [Gemmatimonadota bacterium]MBT5329554.1 efflux RND transporter permease subunit [Gemmatimonadota bacterium]MBT5448496.1 efflux RND transporter permease subunit [Gemmatimonadota bacterium]MBT5803614.1 efflux RND transporter permease subunit [Gemmatimonadota bacterium]MBT6618349.1 efflux RND transporter permease subunit [Gemmatimonadota bacterium]